MAIIDTYLQFSDSGDFAIETSTGAIVGDVIDLGLAGRDVGNGQPLYLVLHVETAGDGGAGGNGTTQFKLASDSTAAVAVDGTETIHLITEEFAGTDLDLGDVYVWPVPYGAQSFERYLALQIIQGTEGEDDLVCTAYLTSNPSYWKSYADATN